MNIREEYTTTTLYESEIQEDDLTNVCKKLFKKIKELDNSFDDIHLELEKLSERISNLEDCMQDNEKKLNLDRLRL
jgi:prefoldin subunit 5